MKRRLFNILSALSLLLCVAMAALWILNMWVRMEWHYSGETVVSCHGCIEVVYTTQLTGEPFGFAASSANDGYYSDWKYLGFDGSVYSGTESTWFDIPDWFICSITAVLPCLWYRSFRRRRLAERKGLCPKCGYDLRASKDRCPECGTPMVPTEAKA